ncbi:MAG: hypothetical protein WAO20_01265, partial [Acidobacteriota bacterium]
MTRLPLFFLVILGWSPAVEAGGPNYLDYAGGFARWDTSQSIPFKVDNGPLKKAGTTVILSRDQGRQIIDDETARWTDVSTSTFAFRDSGFLAVDIT